ELVIERQLADRVDLDPRRARDLKTLPRGAVACRHDGGDRGRLVGRARGVAVFLRRDAARTRDLQPELLVQAGLDVWAAILRTPAESNDVVQVEFEIAIEGNRGSGIRRVVG